MGFVELIVVVVFGVAPTAGLAYAARIAKGDDAEDEPRAALPVSALVGAVLTMLAGAAAGAMAGHPFTFHVLVPSGGDSLVLLDPERDWAIASFYGAALTTVWGALPGSAAALWLLLSRSRSLRAALALAALVALGFTAGVLLCVPILEASTSSLEPLQLTLVDLVASSVRAMFGVGIAFASAGAVGVTTAAARPSPRRLLRIAAPLPLFATLVAALTTPPDVVTQLAMATVIGVGWVAGLGGGALASRRMAPTR